MPFNKEHEMYDILADWLRNREVNPCEATSVDKKEDWAFSFSFGGKKHRVDVIGLYTYDDGIRFVGIEAKLEPRKVLSASRQALPLANFCHEVYVAVPEETYRNLSSRQQGELRAQLLKVYTGLLLVRETGKVKVTNEIPLEPNPFSLDLHKEAEEHFRWTFDAHSLLDVFRNRTGKRELKWLKEDWTVDEYYCWVHNKRGQIDFEEESIEIVVNIHLKKFLTGVSTTFSNIAIQVDPLSDLTKELRGLVKDGKIVTLPVLKINPEYTTAFIEIDVIDEETLPSIASLVRTMGHPEVVLNAKLHRPAILKPNEDEEDFIDLIRVVYDRLLKFAHILESFKNEEMTSEAA